MIAEAVQTILEADTMIGDDINYRTIEEGFGR